MKKLKIHFLINEVIPCTLISYTSPNTKAANRSYSKIDVLEILEKTKQHNRDGVLGIPIIPDRCSVHGGWT